jgi:hypothetical protein
MIAHFVDVEKDGRRPSPIAKLLARVLAKRQKIDIFWDDGGIDVADPKERLPRGLYLEMKKKLLFLAIDGEVLETVLEKNADE